jgi:hypothetical protein
VEHRPCAGPCVGLARRVGHVGHVSGLAVRLYIKNWTIVLRTVTRQFVSCSLISWQLVSCTCAVE